MPPFSGAAPRSLVFALFAGLLGFAVAAFAPQIFHDGDSWWHLAAGGWMLDHHAVLKRDIFSFTFSGRPWDAQEWLAEVAMALSFSRRQLERPASAARGGAYGATTALVAGGVRARVDTLPALLISIVGLACLSGSSSGAAAFPGPAAAGAVDAGTAPRPRTKTGASLVAAAADAALGQSAWQLRFLKEAGGGLRIGSRS